MRQLGTREIAVFLALLTASAASAGPLENLFELRDARTRRISSADENWQDGNGDARTLPVGETRLIADVAGPGIIRHIWFTFYGHDPKQGRGLVLRMYWDGSQEPAVESPIGDFFAVGHGALRKVNSQVVSVSSEARAFNCYWPMPFREHARITITNESTYHAGVFWYVDYEEVDALPDATSYFHAQYRQEYPAHSGDYLILDTEGRGHYVGTVLSTRFRSTGWYGEGDDRFFSMATPSRLDTLDLYRPEVEAVELPMGHVNLEAGEHRLEFECLGKDPASKSYHLGIDAIIFEEVEPFHVVREMDDEQE